MKNKTIAIALVLGLFSCKSLSTKTETTTAQLEYQVEAQLGEGAFWNYKTQELYWIDIEGKKLNIYNPKSKTNKVIKTDSRIGTVVPVNETEVLTALEDGVYKTNVTTGTSTLFTNMTDVLKERRLNDGKCDPSGRFWVGSMHLKQETGKAKLFAIDETGKLTVKIDSVTISNGIVWTANKKTMYYIDTPTSTIKSYDFDNTTGTISNGKIAVEIPISLGFPDGMAIDSEDMVWVGMWNGNAVIRFNPKTGKVIQKIEVPAHNITSCAFGGKNLDELYITSARVDMTDEELIKYPLSGSVFKVIPGVKGVKSSFFKSN